MIKIDYEKTVRATRIGTNVERFTSEFEVISVNLAFSEDGESEILSIQRGLGLEAEEEEGICIVSSPSQQCCYNPFEELILERNFLGIRFTDEAKLVFNVSSALITFHATEELFQEFKERLSLICKGESYFIEGRSIEHASNLAGN